MTDTANGSYGNNKAGSGATDTHGPSLSNKGFETRAIHVGQSPDQWSSGIIVPPIHMGTTFKQYGPGLHKGYSHGRGGTPSRNSLEKCIASLDNAKYAFAFSSGMATVTCVSALVKPGDHVICGEDIYGGTNRHFAVIGKNNGLEVDFIDTTNVELVEKAIKPNTKLVWIESPSNPLLKVTDIPSVAAILKAKNQGIIFVVDNTFLTPYLQKPLDLGADIAMYSMTKYMNGHSDIIMGALTTNDDELSRRIPYIENYMGLIPSPFDCYLVTRGLKTLALRMERHTHNATEVAKFLEQHPLIEKVNYPGLESHPQYNLSKKLSKGASGIVSFYIKGNLQTSTAFSNALKIFTIAGSLGDCESLISLPVITSHGDIPEEERIKIGITDNLIRLSVGLETTADLIDDIDQALKVVAAGLES
ncbi:putative cystathionine gamma-lyase 2 [Halyomorpha halys]|uniref:putative cystathionine gamma-lyase 2 n=1 Tax=Halyomorpha halys TaxID=286706 RepID=UPI0006D4D8EE|nr:putative cystathionine gamma-lyase 2 [Halyomorpha halys]